MAQRGGPWRLAGYPIADPAVARRTSVTQESVARGGDRLVDWIVGTYVLGLVGGGLVALIGLSAGWW